MLYAEYVQAGQMPVVLANKFGGAAGSDNLVNPGGQLGVIYNGSTRDGQVRRSKYLGNIIFKNR